MSDHITTNTVRLVQGDLFVPQTKDLEGRPLIGKDGLPRQQWFIGIAIPKGPEWDRIWAHITAAGMAAFQPAVYNDLKFAWKCSDGDAGRNVGKEGRAGCMILRCTTGFAPTIYDNSAQPQQIIDAAMAPRGYWIQVDISVVGNESTSKPGVYNNFGMVRVVAPGALIQSGPSAADVFGAPAAAPPGALAAPPALAPIAVAPAPVVAPVAVGVVPPQATTVPVTQAPPVVPQAAPAPVPAPAAPALPVVAPAVVPPLPGTVGSAAALQPGAPGAVAPAPGFIEPPF